MSSNMPPDAGQGQSPQYPPPYQSGPEGSNPYGQQAPYGQTPYGQSPYGGGYGGPPMKPSNGAGTTALVLGVLSIIFFGLFTGIPAIIFGRKGMQRAATGQATNGGMAKAGYICGIIGTAWSVIATIWVLARG